MNLVATLLKKELKEHRMILLFLVLATLLLDGYLLLTGSANSAKTLWVLAPYVGTLFVLPFILAHAVTSEWKSDTVYLLLALPVRNLWIPVVKLLALLGYALVLFFLSTLGGYAVYLRFFSDHIRIAPQDFWFIAAVIYFTFTFFFCALVTVMEAAKFSVHRYRGLLGTGVFLVVLVLFSKIGGPFVDAFNRVAHYTITISVEGRVFTETVRLGDPIFAALVGVVLLGIAMLLFETKVEV